MASVLTVTNTLGRPAADAEILKATVGFANGAGLELIGTNGKRHQASDQDRVEFAKVMTSALADPIGTAYEALPRFSEKRDLIEVFTVSDKSGLQRQLRVDFRSIRALLDHALLLILDRTNPVGRLVCRCKLPRCGVFYIAGRNKRGGGLNLTFCRPEHREEHHNSSDRRLGRI